MKIDERLRNHLDEQRNNPFIRGTGPAEAMRRGERLQRRNRVGSMLASVALVGAVGLAVAVFPATPAEMATEPTTQTTTTAADVLVPDAFSWQAVNATVGYSQELFATADGFYALSTAPGVTREEDADRTLKAVYRSEDGTTWTHELLGDELRVGDIAGRGGTLYALGTAPSVASTDPEVIRARVGTSTDGGASWSYTDLPSVATPPLNMATVIYTSNSTHIAANTTSIVASVTTSYVVNYQALAPPEYQNDGYFVNPTPSGIQVIDARLIEEADIACADAWEAIDTGAVEPAEIPEPCQAFEDGLDLQNSRFVVFEAAWSELGIADPDPLSFSELFVSQDGINFDSVATPFASLADLFAVGDGFIALDWGPNGLTNQLWRSTNGRTWTRADDVPQLDWIIAAGALHGGIAIVGTTTQDEPTPPRTMVLWSPTGAAPWTQIDLATLMPAAIDGYDHWINDADIGPLGIAIAVNSWYETESGGETRTDQSAKTTTTAVPVVEAEYHQANHFLFSSDLQTWSVTPVEDLNPAGSKGYIDNIVVGTDRVLARIGISNGTGELTSIQLIGTPMN
jgi:hypothetical protein